MGWRWWRRAEPRTRELRVTGEVTYVGFKERVPYLYEFFTEAGEHVYLHDMACVGIDFAPLRRELTLTFVTVDGAVIKPMTATLTFSGAHLLEWDSDPTEDGPDKYAGQVTDLCWDDGVFALVLLENHVYFDAVTVTCRIALAA